MEESKIILDPLEARRRKELRAYRLNVVDVILVRLLGFVFLSILLAEDNPVNQKLAKTMLTKAGYKVEVANDGKEAVEKFTSSPDGFDLIFMDVQMPEMDGLEATAKIREKELELATRNPNPYHCHDGGRHEG